MASDAQKIQAMVLQLNEASFHHEIGKARPCEGHADILNDPARPRAHHQYMIGEK